MVTLKKAKCGHTAQLMSFVARVHAIWFEMKPHEVRGLTDEIISIIRMKDNAL